MHPVSKRSHITLAARERRSSFVGWSWRAAWACVLSGGLSGGLAGCSSLPGLPEPVPTPPLTTAQRERFKAAKGYTSLAKTLSKIDAKTLKAYIDRFSKPQSSGSARGEKTVYIDASALARQHPAWKLADALEQGLLNPTTPRTGPTVVTNPEGIVVEPNLSPPSGELYRLAPQRRLTVPTNFMDATMRGRQGLDAFLANWSERQAQARRDDAFLARRALEDEIAVSTRGNIDLMPLDGVSAKTALELSNLRLKLLSNLPTPLPEREATKTRIAQIEAELQARWQAQTDAQEARLREVFIDTPARLRREGEERFAAAERERENQDREARLQLRRDVEATLTADASDMRAEDLRLPLPSTRVPLPPVTSLGRSVLSGQSRLPIPLPPVELPPAFTPLATKVAIERIARLRQLARTEARLWAQRSAAAEGARLTSSRSANSQVVPDHTKRALQLLRGQSRLTPPAD